MSFIDVDAFERQMGCTYRGDKYSARDNGAVFRHFREGKRKRLLDGKWKFGKQCASSGYMKFSGQAVHRIVATAFHGPQPTKDHVVDHIDTNRCNNRPENLRWVTRLENILLNPVTAKRVKYHYVSIENFLADPSRPRNGELQKDFEWMRTVTPAEAEYSRKRLLERAYSDRPSAGGTLGDWIYEPDTDTEDDSKEVLIQSKTPGALQLNWHVPAEFPLCPNSGHEDPLETYFERLEERAVFAVSPFNKTIVSDAAISIDGASVFILGAFVGQAVKPWSLVEVTYEGGDFVHESCGTFFAFEGAAKQFNLIQGLPWEGGDSIDDYS